MELALGIGGRAVPAALLPEDVVEVGIGMVMHAGTEINEPLRPLNQRGQDVGRQRVYCEDVRQAIRCYAMPFPIAYSNIMDHPPASVLVVLAAVLVLIDRNLSTERVGQGSPASG